MNRLLYEKSVSYKGYLIIPFVYEIADEQSVYSYKLLSELGRKGRFHTSDNPANLYSNSLERLIDVAKEHLAANAEAVSEVDYFKHRYTYRNNLIIVHEAAAKYFYDHYKPDDLNNIAAPKLFKSEYECISWIKRGLDRSRTSEEAKKV